MVVMDATFLMLLLDPDASPPTDENTGAPVEQCKERIELLLASLSKGGVRVLIPAPVVSEVLVGLGTKKAEILQALTSGYAFKVQAFDAMAAIEVAFLTDADLQSGKKLSKEETHAKLKYDRQIVAIAKVAGAKTLYTDDNNLAKKAKSNGLEVVRIWQLPLPPVSPQTEIWPKGSGNF